MNRLLLCAALAFMITGGLKASGYHLEGSRKPSGFRTAAAQTATDAAFVKQYCVTCHNSRLRTGGLALDALDPAKVTAHAETWEKVVRKLKTGMMPPIGAPRPDRARLDAFAAALEGRLDRSPSNAHLVAPALHRLNRA